MTPIQFDCRLQGCLVGAAIGAELGFARLAHPDRFDIKQPKNLLSLDLQPAGQYQLEPNRLVGAKLTPFIDLGVRAYTNKNGRVTPTDFATLFKDDAGVAAPAFAFDGLHSTQELLKEGMPALISGYGAAPCGLIAACMPAVGIYHFADPEYAYLDGVELASVVQPRLGADWAALCAAAIAAAFDPSAQPEAIAQSVLGIAHANNKELYYELTAAMRLPGWATANDEAFATWWYQVGGVVPRTKECMWVSYNPIRYVLPLLARFAKDPQQFMRLLVGTQLGFYMEGRVGGHTVAAIIGGAILGALHGPQVFPAEWLEWAQPIAADWQQAMGRVVRARQQEEVRVLAVMDQLTQTRQQGRTLLHDKIYGCILAGAIGNAMGSPVETQYYWEIDQNHPGGIQTVLDPKRLESEDDNQMAMLLVETYLDRDGLPVIARHFGKTWREKLDRDYFFTLCMGNAYDLICQGWDPRIIGQWSQVTGSTVMCMEPVGLYHAADPEFARIDAIAISHMYQRGLDVAAAGDARGHGGGSPSSGSDGRFGAGGGGAGSADGEVANLRPTTIRQRQAVHSDLPGDCRGVR